MKKVLSLSLLLVTGFMSAKQHHGYQTMPQQIQGQPISQQQQSYYSQAPVAYSGQQYGQAQTPSVQPTATRYKGDMTKLPIGKHKDVDNDIAHEQELQKQIQGNITEQKKAVAALQKFNKSDSRLASCQECLNSLLAQLEESKKHEQELAQTKKADSFYAAAPSENQDDASAAQADSNEE
jgi:hypothetical protein